MITGHQIYPYAIGGTEISIYELSKELKKLVVSSVITGRMVLLPQVTVRAQFMEKNMLVGWWVRIVVM